MCSRQQNRLSINVNPSHLAPISVTTLNTLQYIIRNNGNHQTAVHNGVQPHCHRIPLKQGSVYGTIATIWRKGNYTTMWWTGLPWKLLGIISWLTACASLIHSIGSIVKLPNVKPTGHVYTTWCCSKTCDTLEQTASKPIFAKLMTYKTLEG